MVRMRRNCKNKKIFSYLALLFKLPFHHIILQQIFVSLKDIKIVVTHTILFGSWQVRI